MHRRHLRRRRRRRALRRARLTCQPPVQSGACTCEWQIYLQSARLGFEPCAAYAVLLGHREGVARNARAPAAADAAVLVDPYHRGRVAVGREPRWPEARLLIHLEQRRRANLSDQCRALIEISVLRRRCKELGHLGLAILSGNIGLAILIEEPGNLRRSLADFWHLVKTCGCGHQCVHLVGLEAHPRAQPGGSYPPRAQPGAREEARRGTYGGEHWWRNSTVGSAGA